MTEGMHLSDAARLEVWKARIVEMLCSAEVLDSRVHMLESEDMYFNSIWSACRFLEQVFMYDENAFHNKSILSL